LRVKLPEPIRILLKFVKNEIAWWRKKAYMVQEGKKQQKKQEQSSEESNTDYSKKVGEKRIECGFLGEDASIILLCY